MSMITANPHSAVSTAAPSRAMVTSMRDPRLDFYRGIAMFIILFAHTPGNFFTSWIPARWGFSDATEMFVFCSGMASAIAFGRTFDRAGLLMGAARVGYRVWQVYWAHIGLFFATLALAVFLVAFYAFDMGSSNDLLWLSLLILMVVRGVIQTGYYWWFGSEMR